MINARKFDTDQEYRNTLYDKIAPPELPPGTGDIVPLHFGASGVPIMGAGFELLVRPRSRKPFVPRDRIEINDHLSATIGRPFQISDADWARLNNAAAKVNGGDPDEAIKQMAGSRERQALVSLRYNNVSAPKTIAALLRGDRATVYLEIAYRSNKGKSSGLAKRRIAETRDVIGDPATWSADQKRRWREVYDANRKDIDAYEQRYGRHFPAGRRLRDLVKEAGHALPSQPGDERVTVKPGETLGEIARRESARLGRPITEE